MMWLRKIMADNGGKVVVVEHKYQQLDISFDIKNFDLNRFFKDLIDEIVRTDSEIGSRIDIAREMNHKKLFKLKSGEVLKIKTVINALKMLNRRETSDTVIKWLKTEAERDEKEASEREVEKELIEKVQSFVDRQIKEFKPKEELVELNSKLRKTLCLPNRNGKNGNIFFLFKKGKNYLRSYIGKGNEEYLEICGRRLQIVNGGCELSFDKEKRSWTRFYKDVKAFVYKQYKTFKVEGLCLELDIAKHANIRLPAKDAPSKEIGFSFKKGPNILKAYKGENGEKYIELAGRKLLLTKDGVEIVYEQNEWQELITTIQDFVAKKAMAFQPEDLVIKLKNKQRGTIVLEDKKGNQINLGFTFKKGNNLIRAGVIFNLWPLTIICILILLNLIFT